MQKARWTQSVFEKNLKDNFRANSLDSLANSSNQSESFSDESHDSDSGAETKSKNSFAVKCDVYAKNDCGSIRSWTKSECSNSERSYEYVSNDKKDFDKRMETIPEEGEPKVSVKEILARFENLNDKKDSKDCNNNSYSVVSKAKDSGSASGASTSSNSSLASSAASTSSSNSNSSSSNSSGAKAKINSNSNITTHKEVHEVKNCFFNFFVFIFSLENTEKIFFFVFIIT